MPPAAAEEPPAGNEPFAGNESFASTLTDDEDERLTNQSFGTISSKVADRDKGASPEDQACFATKLFYGWLTPLINAGVAVTSGKDGAQKRPLLPGDLLELPAEEFCDEVYESTFLPIWEAELLNPANPAIGPSLSTALKKAFGGQVYVGAVFKFIADACQVCIPVVLQVQLRWIGRFVDDPEDHKDRMWEGYMLSVLIMAMMLVFTYCFNASTFYTSKAFMKMRTASMLAIFDKSVKLPASHGFTGRVSQMHGTDCSRFLETSMLVQQVWSAPVFIVACVIVLYLFIGPAAFVGLAVAIITVPLQGIAAQTMGQGRFLASRMTDKRLQRVNEFVQGIRIIKFMSWERQFEGRFLASRMTDKRLQRVNEFVQGIRIIKFMSWERQFAAKTEETRQAEMVHLLTMHKARAVFQVMLTYAPLVIAFATFATAYGLGNDMRAADVFPAFAVLNVLRVPLTIMPLAAAKLIELKVSVERINAFLLTADHEPIVRDVAGPVEGEVADDDDRGDENVRAMLEKDLGVFIPDVTVVFEQTQGAANDSMAPPTRDPKYQQPQQQQPSKGAAGGAPEEDAEPRVQRVPLMSVAGFEVPRGKLTIVIGPTAGGKSTLVNAIMGETLVSDESSKVYRRGTIGFVPQEAWIMNATLRDNILMGKEYDEAEYKAALLACQLKSDLEQLPGSDKTEIGERGINLSGGQKQRVAFARAVYSDRDIVVMDDPLSAVDPHVCGALFHSCIRTALSGKTRVLVTHQQQFLEWADQVVVVAERRVVFRGTYAEMQKSEEALKYASPSSPNDNKRGAESTAETLPEEVLAAMDETVSQITTAAESSIAAGKSALQKLVLTWDVPKPRAGAGGGSGATSLMQAEKQDLSAIGWPIFSWYCGQSGWGVVCLTWFCYVVWRVSSLFGDLYLSWWATRTPAFGKYEHTGDEYLMWYGILIAITGVFVVLRMVPLVAGMVNASRLAHSRVVTALLKSPMSFFDTTPTGRILNRCSKDLEMLDVVVPETLSIFYNLALVVIGAWILQTFGAWPMPIVYAIVVALFYYFFSGYVVTNHGVKRLDAVMRSPVLSIMNEALGGLPTIRAYAMAEPYRVTHSERLHDMNRSSYAWRNLQRWLAVRTDLLSALVIGSVGMIAIGLLSTLSEENRHEFYPIAALGITYAIVVTGAVGFLTTMLAELIAAFSSVERVREYADELEQEREVTYTTAPDADAAAAARDEKTLLPLTAAPPPAGWPKAGAVTFDNLFLRYRPGLDLVLRGVSFHAEAGEKVGIVGRTGSGKSTIMLALFRMIEADKTV
eukprot:CAMPEP_0174878814 /NCGR_PEP_ID=MMETSP1114-20130205/82947_1 /TAXON_ID=312471 /ORGANISM="Neobodo designis, Strain CCAP 1951/1" /LENGTH=1291 /DNA_ID=CAMNT_0016114203 /DNA_START=29 /DNA_END=3901 /DNA_ORIENTATION=-